MEHIFDLIRAERARQDAKWGSQRHLDDRIWLPILVEEIGEVAKEILEGHGTLIDELVQVAAVTVNWLEALHEDSQRTP
jgi:NTP pyrophosphatase (non-canonical NTP hydrolase)